jgi:hypothetical protein
VCIRVHRLRTALHVRAGFADKTCGALVAMGVGMSIKRLVAIVTLVAVSAGCQRTARFALDQDSFPGRHHRRGHLEARTTGGEHVELMGHTIDVFSHGHHERLTSLRDLTLDEGLVRAVAGGPRGGRTIESRLHDGTVYTLERTDADGGSGGALPIVMGILAVLAAGALVGAVVYLAENPIHIGLSGSFSSFGRFE